ncbi:hypothetical protein [Paenibacillus sp. GCM10027626]|uniref:hypothetical protein n=1 Tax=Paenibacillus sp. GCM10027626 TaxID=3273411 RepID=UPI0036316431
MEGETIAIHNINAGSNTVEINQQARRAFFNDGILLAIQCEIEDLKYVTIADIQNVHLFIMSKVDTWGLYQKIELTILGSNIVFSAYGSIQEMNEFKTGSNGESTFVALMKETAGESGYIFEYANNNFRLSIIEKVTNEPHDFTNFILRIEKLVMDSMDKLK